MANFGVTNSTIPAGSAQVALIAGSTYYSIIAAAASTGNTNQTTFSNPQALKRGKLYDLLVGTNSSPSDAYVEYQVARVTVSTTAVFTGTVSSVSSAYMLDISDAGFGSLVTMNATAGSSAVLTQTGAQLWYVGVNQRASYRWVAAPGSELLWPANTSASPNGLSLLARSNGTPTVTASVMISES